MKVEICIPKPRYLIGIDNIVVGGSEAQHNHCTGIGMKQMGQSSLAVSWRVLEESLNMKLGSTLFAPFFVLWLWPMILLARRIAIAIFDNHT